ncbi:BTAD domain-containing putative transcriptional regulator [Streptomyces sp. NPDC041068]|uniref:AfsR/SARP family transcriptional regulator n=1 Tax=Streptomyces sp. NPDC041068 TaxID=3155130 RepID=UPI0033D700AC
MGDQAVPRTLRFELLGPLRAWREGVELDLGQPQQRGVLAILLLNANRSLSQQQLMSGLWGMTPPAHAVNLLQRHASGLRRVLEPGRRPRSPSRLLAWTAAGYRLTVPPDRLDLHDFDREVHRARAARRAGNLPAAAVALHEALGLWRGQVCEGLSGPSVEAERQRLEERRLKVLEERIEVDLGLRDPFDLVGDLRRLVADQPTREPLHGLLMLALYRAGHQAEALAAFRQARRSIRERIGTEPTGRLQRLHERILAGDPALDVPQPGSAAASEAGLGSGPAGLGSGVAGPASGPAGSGSVPAGTGPQQPDRTRPHHPLVPAQLPHRTRDFVGRADALARLDALLPGEGHSTGGAVVITAIGGTAGVGKTALAVYWAHRIRGRFPDGQLYVNLRGFDPTGSPMHPAEAVRGFLNALAVPPEQMPLDPEGQSALYRTLLASRRMLVVLDNARDAEQVRPLLPGSSGCLVVVTSRNDLAGLVATGGAHPVTVDLLSTAEAREMLARRIGRREVDAEPAAVDDIIASCARLPLALAIVAARAALHPGFPLGVLAKELHTVDGGLGSLDGGDPASNVRTVFSWSYHRLRAPTARMFRLLGLHPAPEIGALAAVALAGLPPAQGRSLLAELSRAQLITECAPGRFTRHDLLRAYAAERARTQDTDAERHAALRRMLDHYLHTAFHASALLNPHRDDPIELAGADAAVPVERFADHRRALEWFAREHTVLLAVIRQAADGRTDGHAWRLAWALRPFSDRQGLWHDAATIDRTALAAASRQSDTRGQAVIHGCLAYAYMGLGQYGEVHRHADRALALFDELADAIGQAHAHRTSAWALDQQRRYQEALAHAQQALKLFETAGHRTGQARALNAVGWFHSQLGDLQQGLAYCRRAVELQEELGDRFNQADTWDSLGYVHRRLDRREEALACYEKAIELYRDIGDRYNEANTLCSLGTLHRDIGDVRAARTSWQDALTVLDELGHPDAVQVRADLARLRDTRSVP